MLFDHILFNIALVAALLGLWGIAATTVGSQNPVWGIPGHTLHLAVAPRTTRDDRY